MASASRGDAFVVLSLLEDKPNEKINIDHESAGYISQSRIHFQEILTVMGSMHIAPNDKEERILGLCRSMLNLLPDYSVKIP